MAALILDAKEAGAGALAFVRDSDGHETRERDILTAILAHQSSGSEVDVIGGVAVPVLEGWLLAVQGEAGTEDLGKVAALRRFAEKDGISKDTAAMVQIAEEGDLTQLPSDARSLRTWLETAGRVFSRRIST